MKIITKIIIAIIVIAAVAGYFYVQKNKKLFVKDSIDNALKQKTDSLYFIHYDSSAIDEVNGDASFYNVSLQSDSLQKEILKSTDSLPNTMYNIHVAEIKITGVDIVGLLQNETVAAKKIFLNKPVVQIINTGSDKPIPSTYNDTVELYRRILGKFKSIKADAIQINHGTVLMTDKTGKALTTLENINVDLNNFLVDDVHNYQNIVSYFIKDVKLSVENIQLPELKNGTRINIGNLSYNAPKKILHVDEIQQYRTGNIQPLIDLKNITIDKLNTDAFILSQQLKAGMITCDGGLITVYRVEKAKTTKEKGINFSSDMIDEIEVGGMNLNSTKIILLDTSKAKEKPFVLNDVKFKVSKVNNVTDGSKISDIINSAKWQLSIGSFSFFTKDKLYDFKASDLLLDNDKKYITVKNIEVQPQLSEEQFSASNAQQKDRFDFAFNNILLQGVDFNKFISDNVLDIDKASLQPIIKIFEDRNLPSDTTSKVGKYPQQQLAAINFPFYIKVLEVKNGFVAYKERSKKQLAGTVFFSKVNAELGNVTNVQERIKANGTLTLNATTLFMGTGRLTTQWRLPLDIKDTNFIISGSLGQMNTTILNPLSEPLGMVSIKKGKVKKLNFNLSGGNYISSGKVSLLYNDLDIKVLKINKDNELKTKGTESFLANAIIYNSNPEQGKARTGIINYNRNIDKSFFNLLWRSIFSGVKKIVVK